MKKAVFQIKSTMPPVNKDRNLDNSIIVQQLQKYASSSSWEISTFFLKILNLTKTQVTFPLGSTKGSKMRTNPILLNRDESLGAKSFL